MKQIYACLIGLCGVAVVSVAAPVSAKTLSIGIEVSERHGVHHDWLERNRFLYNVVENSMPDNSYGGRRDPQTPYQRMEAESSGNDMNDDINLPDSGVNRTMTPSADVPDSVRGQSGAPNVVPDIRPGGDPGVRDLSGSGVPGPGSAPAGTLGR
jgi:hypothetical protein